MVNIAVSTFPATSIIMRDIGARHTGSAEQSSENYASLVSGGGGAFFDSTETLIGQSERTVNGKTEKGAR